MKSGEIDFVRDYTHRTNTIDLMISFDLRLPEEEREENSLYPYFQYHGAQKKAGSQLTAYSAIPYGKEILVPDLNIIQRSWEETRLYTLELERQPKAKRIIQDKVFAHAQLLSEGALAKKSPILEKPMISLY